MKMLLDHLLMLLVLSSEAVDIYVSIIFSESRIEPKLVSIMSSNININLMRHMEILTFLSCKSFKKELNRTFERVLQLSL